MKIKVKSTKSYPTAIPVFSYNKNLLEKIKKEIVTV